MAEFDSSQHTKLYNSQRWEIYALLTDLYNNKTIPLFVDNINSIIITNDLECYSPTIRLKYVDFGFTLSQYFRPNGMILDITLVQPQKEFESESVQLPGKFIINDLKILSQTREIISYEFIGTHVNSTKLIKNINYANNKEQGKLSPYQIISNILTLINYPLVPDFVDTTQKIDFISSQSMSVKDMINYCLHMGVSEFDPPTYFLHRLLDNKAVLLNQKTDLNIMKNDYNLGLQVFTDEGTSLSDLSLQAGNIISNVTVGGIINMKCLSTHVFNDFDHNNRKWTQKSYTAKGISKLLSDITGIDQERVFMPLELMDQSELHLSYPNFEQSKMYDVFRDLELGSNNLQFTIFGELSRDAGQYILLNVQNQNLKSNIFGLWNIYRCAHIWAGHTYTNDIVCYRTINQKTKTNTK